MKQFNELPKFPHIKADLLSILPATIDVTPAIAAERLEAIQKGVEASFQKVLEDAMTKNQESLLQKIAKEYGYDEAMLTLTSWGWGGVVSYNGEVIGEMKSDTKHDEANGKFTFTTEFTHR